MAPTWSAQSRSGPPNTRQASPNRPSALSRWAWLRKAAQRRRPKFAGSALRVFRAYLSRNYGDGFLISRLRAPQPAPIFSPLKPAMPLPVTRRSRRPHGSMTSRSLAAAWPAAVGGGARHARPLTGSRLRKDEAAVRSTAPLAEKTLELRSRLASAKVERAGAPPPA